ncbi:hypothetical protein PPACK8108_LOCUS12733 [Phakopsora pachyrhizi]|uniref:Uncharacterized protein n=1 Tax=Phakopsora pachyrhizi TaxID=170000 RepID=A0AAV0B5B5_PHAPC|nr:hypothetical protein PPACK8108_LOCUS12733 [Phakopsora pachyrhizi]
MRKRVLGSVVYENASLSKLVIKLITPSGEAIKEIRKASPLDTDQDESAQKDSSKVERNAFDNIESRSTIKLDSGEASGYQITLRSSYKSTSATLAQTAFFGASLTYSHLFSYLPPEPSILAWSASFFLISATGAGMMSILGQIDGLWKNFQPNSNDQKGNNSFYPHRRQRTESNRTVSSIGFNHRIESVSELVVKVYGWISVSGALLGLGLLNISMVVGAFEVGKPTEKSRQETNKITIITAGIFSLFFSLNLVMGAIYIEYCFKPNLEKQLQKLGYIFCF